MQVQMNNLMGVANESFENGLPSSLESSKETSEQDSQVLHCSYLSVSLTSSEDSAEVPPPEEVCSLNSPALSGSSLNIGVFRRHRPCPQRRLTQSRPSSPPPATYFPPRRPSLSLPPSPNSGRVHRASLPLLPCPFRSSGLVGDNRNNSCTTSPNSSRPISPAAMSSSPPFSRRNRRRSARTPSPRPPLPLPTPPQVVPNDVQHLPQAHNSRSSSNPHKSKMRSR